MKPFDEIFREKLKEALNNYEAGHLAAKGWDSFMEKRKAGTRRLFIMPLWAKAASLLIIISAGTILTYKILTRQEEAAKVITLSQPVLADSAGQAAAEATPEELVTVPGRLAARNDIGSLKNTTTERSSLLPVKTVKTGDHAAAVQEDIAVNRMVENEPERIVELQEDSLIREKYGDKKLPADAVGQNIPADDALKNLIAEDTVKLEKHKMKLRNRDPLSLQVYLV